MQSVIKFIQENPYVILVGFVLAIISGVMGIATSWTPFKNLLQRKVSIPYYVVWLFFIAFIISLLFRNRNADEITEFKLIEGKAFGTQTIRVEGKSFVRCTFKGTKFMIEGKYGFTLESCRLEGVTFAVDGSAKQTIRLLTQLYKIPEVRPIIEATLNNIRTDNHPETPDTVDL